MLTFSAGLFAQAAERQVALLPFSGDDANVAEQFREELYNALLGMDGFYPVWIEQAAVPPGSPPSFVIPPRDLTAGSPLAMTGDVFNNPLSGQWHMRIWLWQMVDARLLFSEEVAAFDRETIGMILPFVLEWVFSWVPLDIPEQPAPPTIVEQPFVPPAIAEQPPAITADPPAVATPRAPRVLRDRSPLEGMHAGLYAGWNPHIFSPFIETDRIANVSVGLHYNWHPLHGFPFFNWTVSMGPQIEAVLMQDWGHDVLSLTFPVLATFKFQGGTSWSTTLLGGAYLFLPLGSGFGSSASDPGIDFGDGGFGPFAGLGLTAGFRVGNTIGIDRVFFDVRWSGDLFQSQLDGNEFRRNMLTISAGLEFAFARSRR